VIKALAHCALISAYQLGCVFVHLRNAPLSELFDPHHPTTDPALPPELGVGGWFEFKAPSTENRHRSGCTYLKSVSCILRKFSITPNGFRPKEFLKIGHGNLQAEKRLAQFDTYAVIYGYREFV